MFIRKQEGFTLIELLIVIVIIGVLAAIAIPKFTQNKAAATEAACKANLSMLDSAQERYQFENSAYASMAQLVSGNFIKSEPRCPAGTGAYTFTSGAAVCPNAGTYPTHTL